MTEGASEGKNIGLTLIIIFVLAIAILTLFPASREKAFDVFDEVLGVLGESAEIGVETLSEDSRETSMKNTFDTFVANIESCSGTMCDLEKGVIYDEYYIGVYNQEGNLGLVMVGPDQTFLGEEKKSNIQVGIAVIKEEENELHLGCIYPDYFQIYSDDATTTDLWVIGYEGEHSFYTIVDYSVSGQTNSTNFLDTINDNGNICLISEMIESKYTGDLEFNKVSDYDFSIGNNINEDLLFRFFALDGEASEEDLEIEIYETETA